MAIFLVTLLEMLSNLHPNEQTNVLECVGFENIQYPIASELLSLVCGRVWDVAVSANKIAALTLNL